MTFPLIPVNADPTAQEVFDVAVEYLLNQEERCVVRDSFGSDACVYRNPAGNACAVGAFLPDDSPALSFNCGVKELVKYWCRDTPAWFENHLALLVSLQAQHDWYDRSSLKHRLSNTARRYGLRMPVLSR